MEYNSDYAIRLATLRDLGGDVTKQYDSVYEIDLEILKLIGSGENIIDDSVVSSGNTWSSQKISSELSGKQGTLSAGPNIAIDSADTISAKGYVWDDANGGFAEKYIDEDTNTVESNTAGYSSHAEGYATVASGGYGAHSEGLLTAARGLVSHAEGYSTIASGQSSHSEGQSTRATGVGSHAEGYGGTNYPNIASGQGSHAEGCGTTAQNSSEHAEGSNNLSHKASDSFGNAGNTLHSIGDSDVMNVKHNALEIMQNADVYIKGIGGYQGTDTKVQNVSIMTVQEVINSKADAYQTASTAEIEALFA